MLKKDGVIFVNLGDTYGGNKIGKTDKKVSDYLKEQQIGIVKKVPGFEKSLLMIPERFALGMIERGWILRNRICWYKRNAMPSSVKDRFTCTWEYIYFFSKSKRYYFNLDSVRIPHKQVSKERVLRAISNKHKYIDCGQGGIHNPRPNITKLISENYEGKGMISLSKRLALQKTKIPVDTAELYGSPRARYHREQNMAISQYQYGEGDYLVVNLNKKGRNPGDHWDITTKGYKGAHFAVYPEELCLMPIKAGSRRGDIVLDPFAGAGTTCLVAKKLGRQYIGIDLNPEYVKMAEARILKDCGGLF